MKQVNKKKDPLDRVKEYMIYLVFGVIVLLFLALFVSIIRVVF